jgi:hypothetical protein
MGSGSGAVLIDLAMPVSRTDVGDQKPLDRGLRKLPWRCKHARGMGAGTASRMSHDSLEWK